MLRLIIFDFDGPILDSFELAKISINEAAKKLKIARPTKKDFIKNWGYPTKMTVKRMFPGITEDEIKNLISIWAENERRKRPPLVRGVIDSLKKIKEKSYYTALITARSGNLKLHFSDIETEKYFDFFQSFDGPDFPNERIHPRHIFHSSPKDDTDFFDNLLAWMKQNNISPKESLFIDDTLVGLRLARKTNLPFLGVCTGPLSSSADWQKHGNLDKKYVIKSVAELPAWLEKNSGA